MKNTNPRVLFVFVLFLLNTSVYSQTEDTQDSQQDKNLKAIYQDMLNKSENYTDYKVIKRINLDHYNKAVGDSLKSYRKEIHELKTQVNDQKSQITQLSNRIEDLETQLAKSEELRESLSFLGLELNKKTYHSIVWMIIGGLTIFGIFAYTSFTRSNKITVKTKKEYQTLNLEFEDHKKKSYDKQLKIGRELQTERNLIEELKAKIKPRNTPGKLL